jgi:hypothetical protein
MPPVSLVLVSLVACIPPDFSPDDLAAMQLAAATDIVDDIASNPGSIELVCVGYEGDWEDPGLPGLGTRPVPLAYMDGCTEVEGRLVERDGAGQAISVSVGAPEPIGAARAEVRVFTSTGAVDLAVYACSVREVAGGWRSEGCELRATS